MFQRIQICHKYFEELFIFQEVKFTRKQELVDSLLDVKSVKYKGSREKRNEVTGEFQSDFRFFPCSLKKANLSF